MPARPDGDPALLLAQQGVRIQAALEDIQLALRTSSQVLDFYAGYNLEASIADRLDDIGTLEDAENLYSASVGAATIQRNRLGRPTQMARLVALRERGRAAIAAARSLVAVQQAGGTGEQSTEDPDVVIG